MPETSREWHQWLIDQLDRGGLRPQDPLSWTTWPWDDGFVVRSIEAPRPEPPRHGEGGIDCIPCKAVDDPGDYVVWRDEIAMVGRKLEGTPLPILAFLMPRRHTDLGGLTEAEAARMGVLLAKLEVAITEVLDVPRIQAARWGDGSEHLHWWIYGRPTGVLQLRGTFLALWEDLLPLRPPAEERRDLDLVMSRLVELAGGEALPGG